jgi:hypothetical protein
VLAPITAAMAAPIRESNVHDGSSYDAAERHERMYDDTAHRSLLIGRKRTTARV